ncbi:hypothetical protein PM082_000481 [Marasmius tenuissimus]|nr:hypothetical protein PM082_000481 [Marasmius tenuissimus]
MDCGCCGIDYFRSLYLRCRGSLLLAKKLCFSGLALVGSDCSQVTTGKGSSLYRPYMSGL